MLSKESKFRSTLLWVAALLLFVGALGWVATRTEGEDAPLEYRVEVRARHPHDVHAFTQGLLVHDGAVYESTGQYGESSLRRVDLESGEVEEQVDLERGVFAEGLARVDDRLIQLSWREGRALVWDLETLARVGEHSYPGEGWGLCYDGERLIMSTGTDRLVFRDPENFRKLGEVRVTRDGSPVRRLNELECVNGAVYANVWTEEVVVRIDPSNGEVTGWIDASGLLPAEDRHGDEDVMNGIAFLAETGRFLLTGKNWAYVYEVDFVETAVALGDHD